MCIAEDMLQIKKDLCTVRRTYVNTLEVVLRSKVELGMSQVQVDHSIG